MVYLTEPTVSDMNNMRWRLDYLQKEYNEAKDLVKSLVRTTTRLEHKCEFLRRLCQSQRDNINVLGEMVCELIPDGDEASHAKVVLTNLTLKCCCCIMPFFIFQ